MGLAAAAQAGDGQAALRGRPISCVVVTTLLDRAPCLAFDDDFRALGLAVIG